MSNGEKNKFSSVNISEIELAKLAINSIMLNTTKVDEKDIEIGKTKIGGRPDVSSDFVWPVWNSKYLSFIAQIDLEEINKYDQEKILPSEGILYFFYDSDQSTWGFDPKDRGSWKVIYLSGSKDRLNRIEFPDEIPVEARYQACKVEISAKTSLPVWDSIYIEELGLSNEESDAYFELTAEKEDMVINKLLGHPDQIQGDMQLECQLASNGLYCGDSTGYQDPRREILEKSIKDWRLLLQVDSDENCGLMWGDVGRLYFWIKKADLKNKDFEKAWMVLQCY